MLKAVQPVIPVLLGIILIEAALGIVGAVMGIQMASRDVPSFLIGIVFSAYFAGFLAGHMSLQEDPLRKVMEALMLGYGEAEEMTAADHEHGHSHDHDHDHDHGHSHGHGHDHDHHH